jgi:hypothetical protein
MTPGKRNRDATQLPNRNTIVQSANTSNNNQQHFDSSEWTWPINEQVVDVLLKGVYSLVTGYMCDRLVRRLD